MYHDEDNSRNVRTRLFFRPVETVDPTPCEVAFHIRQLKTDRPNPTLAGVYAILGRRRSSGEGDLAERHNVHQP